MKTAEQNQLTENDLLEMHEKMMAAWDTDTVPEVPYLFANTLYEDDFHNLRKAARSCRVMDVVCAGLAITLVAAFLILICAWLDPAAIQAWVAQQ